MDASTFTFKEGDYIRQGQELGKLVKFSVGNNPGVDHLHLHYVRLSREGQQVKLHSLLDPRYFFDWKDTEAPVFQRLRFVSEGTKALFEPDADGVVTVSGRVDILAAIAERFALPVSAIGVGEGVDDLQPFDAQDFARAIAGLDTRNAAAA
jgi:hypothetical protein